MTLIDFQIFGSKPITLKVFFCITAGHQMSQHLPLLIFRQNVKNSYYIDHIYYIVDVPSPWFVKYFQNGFYLTSKILLYKQQLFVSTYLGFTFLFLILRNIPIMIYCTFPSIQKNSKKYSTPKLQVDIMSAIFAKRHTAQQQMI